MATFRDFVLAPSKRGGTEEIPSPADMLSRLQGRERGPTANSGPTAPTSFPTSSTRAAIRLGHPFEQGQKKQLGHISSHAKETKPGSYLTRKGGIQKARNRHLHPSITNIAGIIHGTAKPSSSIKLPSLTFSKGALSSPATHQRNQSSHNLSYPTRSSAASSFQSLAPRPTPTASSTMPGDAPVTTFWGPDPVPLPSRFARIKRTLIAGHESALEASWARLINALRAEIEHIEGLGAHLIPSIEYADIANPAQTARFGRDLRRYGVGVVRRAVPKTDADDMVSGTMRYLETRRTGNLKLLQQDPTCFDFFWTPAQVRARAHPSVLNAQRFMMGLWESGPDDRLATRLPVTYVDRIRIHGPGEDRPNGNVSSQEPPVSADDWVLSLQSSAGIIAQVDNGSLERWEPDGYGRTGTYNKIFQGDWEAYDPWECASRVSSTIDLYNGYGACTIFRMFQGVVALSTIEPGMIRLMPSPQLATAYYLLRPFFSPKTPTPEDRSGPEWDAYLDPSNWKLDRDPDTIIHGAVPGHAQRITEHWHPHLHLRGSMITLPTLQPGDYIFWHPDLPYHISSTKQHPSPTKISMLVYIPAAPLTQTNALYLARQRKAFQRGQPGPDFDSSGRGSNVEDSEGRPGEKDIAEVGGPAGLQAMGLAPWEVAPTPRRRSMDVEGMPGSPYSRAEAEVIKLANVILFPDRSMMGYSV